MPPRECEHGVPVDRYCDICDDPPPKPNMDDEWWEEEDWPEPDDFPLEDEDF